MRTMYGDCSSPRGTGVWGLQLSPAEAGCFCKKQGAQCWSPLGAHRCPSFDTCSINQDCPRCPSSAALRRFHVLQICSFPSDPRCSAQRLVLQAAAAAPAPSWTSCPAARMDPGWGNLNAHCRGGRSGSVNASPGRFRRLLGQLIGHNACFASPEQTSGQQRLAPAPALLNGGNEGMTQRGNRAAREPHNPTTCSALQKGCTPRPPCTAQEQSRGSSGPFSIPFGCPTRRDSAARGALIW